MSACSSYAGLPSDYVLGVQLGAFILPPLGYKTCVGHTKAHHALPRCPRQPVYPHPPLPTRALPQ